MVIMLIKYWYYLHKNHFEGFYEQVVSKKVNDTVI